MYIAALYRYHGQARFYEDRGHTVVNAEGILRTYDWCRSDWCILEIKDLELAGIL